MRVALALIVACAALVQAHPEINCGTFHCTAGWTRKTTPDPFNIACLGGACTNEVCCNPPTCESVKPFTQLTCIFKSNAAQIQCPGSSADGCDARVCCARNQTVATPAPTQQPTNQPTQVPTQRPTNQPTQRPTNQPTQSPTAAPTVGCAPGWTLYFCNYQKDVRVRKMRLNFNEQSGVVSLIAGSIVNVSRPGGGDGIIVNPQNDRELFVGGQQERIFIINTSNPNVDTNWGRQFTTGTRVFHVAAIDRETIIGSHVDGWNNVSYSKLVGGTLPDKSTATVIPVTGAAPKVVSVIPVSNGRIVYTTSTENGEPGNVGFCTITSTALNTQAPFLTNVRAHAGVYQASTDSLFVWGDKVVSQYDLTTGALKSTRDVTALIGTDLGSAGARHVDNGVLFQDRWLLIVANAGKLLWFDLKASSAGLLSQATAGSFIVTGADEFDALTIPVCHA